MKSLIKLIVALILIPLILVGSMGAILYFTYFNVQPTAQYTFLQDEGQIQSIECARFTFSEEGLTPEKVGIVLDTDAFMTDLNAIECHTGIDVNDFKNLVNGQTVDGVIINYTDGSFDIVTPYICVNSTFNPTTIAELLGTKIYGFEKASFAALIDQYSMSLPSDNN